MRNSRVSQIWVVCCTHGCFSKQSCVYSWLFLKSELCTHGSFSNLSWVYLWEFLKSELCVLMEVSQIWVVCTHESFSNLSCVYSWEFLKSELCVLIRVSHIWVVYSWKCLKSELCQGNHLFTVAAILVSRQFKAGVSPLFIHPWQEPIRC